MIRMASLALMTTLAALAGCDYKRVALPYDQRIVAVVQETSRENPVNVCITVDGQPRFGPRDVAPGAPHEIVLHDPTVDSAVTLSAGQIHKIRWQLHRNGWMGKTGHAELTIYSGNQPIVTSSTKYVMPQFAANGWLDLKFEGPGPARPGTPGHRESVAPDGSPGQ